MRAIGIAIPFFRRRSGVPIDAQAQAHFNRVIADGGVVPSGLSGVNAFFSAVKAIYGTSDINTAISAAYDAHYLGYKLGAGSGTTLGQAAQKLYSCSGASGDVVQTTAASQPLLLAHTGENYWWGSGVSGNYVSTPNAAANRVNEIDLTLNLTALDYTPVSIQYLGGMWRNAGQRYYRWELGASGNMNLVLSFDGTNVGQTSTSSVNLTTSNNTNIWLRVTRSASTGDVRFFTSNDASTTNPQSVTWTQLGTTISGATTSIFNTSSAALFEFGSGIAGQAVVLGNIYRGTLSNSIGGTPVVDFNPASYNPSVSQTQWSSATGEVWSLNVGTATTGYKSALVTKSIVMSDGVDDNLLSGNIDPATDKITNYISLRKLAASSNPIYQIGSNTNRMVSAFLSSPNAYTGFNTNSGTTNSFITNTNNALLFLLTHNLDRSQASSDEQNFYFNNSLQAKTQVDVGNTSGNLTNNLTSVFGRIDNQFYVNTILTSLISVKQVDNLTQRTAIYDYLRSINNNAY